MKDFLEEEGYKKSGKIYTPPILQLGDFNGVHWVDELIPEFFWIGLLQKEFGFGNGSNIASKLSEISLLVSTDKSTWFAPISSFMKLSSQGQKTVVNELKKAQILPELQKTFGHINHFYPNFPLNFIFENIETEDDNKLEPFKTFIKSIYDRTSIPANLIQGVALDMIFSTTINLTFDSNSALAEFPKFEEYPRTEISKSVASGIRMTINMLYLNFHKPNSNQDWQNYFWNRGMQIEKCI